ncbi:2-aminoethylphosphonate--pyruvate transaminase [Desulfosarcina widdelii]|uniref:2-aminoethylphosphonate--pyruvate transaminase n=1 Tax=Desulfosarcina widdelii TaxID=947919 RepID=A0A5K7ZJA3_9BACT|nr:2-aminoethylphosphonate--pyruvate transaminase [Desulfosarcina widdelii]BBO78354.1 2-aminoethylphosphonate--pyruvate transaminase [Desulfosarcina widdelii]
MNPEQMPDNPYLLLTPGPLSTTRTVKAAMYLDWCTWDSDYNAIVQQIREDLVCLAGEDETFTSVLMQGSGTFCVEATLTTAVPPDGKLLVVANGAYGRRIAEIARCQGINHECIDGDECASPDLDRIEATLQSDAAITHVAVVHCETTTGMLNPVEEIGRIVKAAEKCFIVDAMSSFGGVPMDMEAMGADYLISSANKCIQGVPGFGFIIARRSVLEGTRGQARSLSLDLYDQWRTMEDHGGKWRFTSPTHVVRAFSQALGELKAEGGIKARHARYTENHRILVEGMQRIGFQPLLPVQWQSPIITAFLYPRSVDWQFQSFYEGLKSRGFVIYPGKVTDRETFRVGNIGDVHAKDMHRLIDAVGDTVHFMARQ